MELHLYIDVINKVLIKSQYSNLGGLLPPFFFGSKVDLKIFPLQPNTVNDPLAPFIPFSWSGYSISAELGSADADDETGPVALCQSFTAISNGVTGLLDLNTQELKDLIGTESSVRTMFEIKATNPSGSPDVVFQTPINANGIVYDPNAMPTPLPTIVSRFITNEVPDGDIDGSNDEFTLANTPVSGSLSLFQNGILMKNPDDYSISAATITFVTPPETDTILLANYIKL